MFSSAIGDPEVRRLARQLEGITANGCVKTSPKRPEKPPKLGGPSSSGITAKLPIDTDVRAADAPFGVVVTQLQVGNYLHDVLRFSVIRFAGHGLGPARPNTCGNILR